jgi:4-hydroxybenzoate polyprenyltransferase
VTNPQAPLCVDLDNTLVRTNTLTETIAGAIRRNPGNVLMVPFWAMRGQGYLWSVLVEKFQPDVSILPYAEPVLDLIRREVSTGRPVILATGAHKLVAQAVAQHLGVFSGVFATNHAEHLVGERKAQILTAAFGMRGFDYVGDSVHDLPVFRCANKAYVVSNSPRLAEQLNQEGTPAVWIPAKRKLASWLGFWSAIRPKQWAKNVLVFVPAILGHRFTDGNTLIYSGVTFVLLCLASSSVYLINDILDIEADRRHHAKRRRAFAQGMVSIPVGMVTGVGFASLAVGLGWIVAPSVSLLLLVYLLGTGLYSIWLKRLLIVDIVMLATFYVFRVFLGAAATGIRVTSWTALFCLFAFTGLAALKRYAEVYNRAAHASDAINRRAYTREDAMPLLSIGTSAFGGSLISLGLYLGSAEVRTLYRTPDLLWLLCPILLAWTSRLWILGHRGDLRDEDPVAFVLHDRWSHWAALLSSVIFLLAL